VMPGMSGPQLAVMIREERPGIRVLFMSGYPADVVTARATLPSSTDYLQKPFTADELLQRVAAVMQTEA
jgi:two-component system cell cycle sensor histidine kinase/response regulator CckA